MVGFFLVYKIILFASSALYKNRTVHMTRLIVPSFSLANSVISVCLQCANATKTNRFQAFSKISFNISCYKNRLETENIFLQELEVRVI